MDVIWVFLTVGIWFLSSGSFLSVTAKSTVAGLVAAMTAAHFTGVHWGLIASVIPIGLLLVVGVMLYGIQTVRGENVRRRQALLKEMGMEEDAVIAGTTDQAPKMSGKKVLVGFWHPYW